MTLIVARESLRAVNAATVRLVSHLGQSPSYTTMIPLAIHASTNFMASSTTHQCHHALFESFNQLQCCLDLVYPLLGVVVLVDRNAYLGVTDASVRT